MLTHSLVLTHSLICLLTHSLMLTHSLIQERLVECIPMVKMGLACEYFHYILVATDHYNVLLRTWFNQHVLRAHMYSLTHSCLLTHLLTRYLLLQAYIVSYEGAKKLLKLCNRATFHVDLDAWRHSSLKVLTHSLTHAYSLTHSLIICRSGCSIQCWRIRPSRVQVWPN